jgi:hypothetical protein
MIVIDFFHKNTRATIHEMTYHRILLLVSGWAGVGSALLAEVAAPLPSAAAAITVAATSSLVSQNVFRGQRLSGAALQPAVEISSGHFTGGVWANLPVRDIGSRRADPEVDLYAAYNLKWIEAVSIAPGVTSYHYPRALTDAGAYRTTLEPNLALNGLLAGGKFTPKIAYDLVLKSVTYELAGYYAVALPALGSELDFTFIAGTYRQADGVNRAVPAVKARGDYWLAGVAAPFAISREAKFTVGLAFTEGRQTFVEQGNSARAPDPLAVGRGVVTLSYTWSF